MRTTKREQKVILIGLCGVLLWAIYALIYQPASDRVQTLKRVIPEKQATLTKLVSIQEEYATIKSQINRIEQNISEQPQGFRLLPSIEALIDNAEMSSYVSQLIPRTTELGNGYVESAIEVKLNDVDLTLLVDLVSKIQETYPFLTVKTMVIQRMDDQPGKLKCTLSINQLGKAPTNA